VIVLRRFVLDRRRSFLGWSLAAVLLVLFTVAFYPTIRDQPSIADAVRDLPEGLKATFGIDDEIPLSSPAGYLQGRMFSLTMPLAMVIFAISSGARALGGSEEDGDLELLVAQSVSRGRVLFERLAAVALLTIALGMVFTTALFVLAPPFGATDGLPVGRVLAACAAATTLAMFHGGLSFAGGTVRGTRSAALGVGGAVAAGGYLLQGLMAAANASERARFVSPWHWFLRRNMLADGLDPIAFLLTMPFLVLAGAISWWSFTHRDLR
jgi:ABC-2 type transport system permease protein